MMAFVAIMWWSSIKISFYCLQLKVGNGEDFFPRNGRWNFNNKVIVCFSSQL